MSLHEALGVSQAVDTPYPDSPWVVLKFGGRSVSTARELGCDRATDSRSNRGRRAARRRAFGARRSLERVDRAARCGHRGRATPTTSFARSARSTTRSRRSSASIPAILDERFRALEQIVAGVKLVGEVSPRVHARVLATGELAATRARRRLSARERPRRRMARRTRVPREHDDPRSNRAGALPFGALRLLRRQVACRSASRRSRASCSRRASSRATRRARRCCSAAAAPTPPAPTSRASSKRGASRSGPTRQASSARIRRPCRRRGSIKTPALPRGAGDRVCRRRHSAPAQHLAGARVRASRCS